MQFVLEWNVICFTGHAYIYSKSNLYLNSLYIEERNAKPYLIVKFKRKFQLMFDKLIFSKFWKWAQHCVSINHIHVYMYLLFEYIFIFKVFLFKCIQYESPWEEDIYAGVNSEKRQSLRFPLFRL